MSSNRTFYSWLAVAVVTIPLSVLFLAYIAEGALKRVAIETQEMR